MKTLILSSAGIRFPVPERELLKILKKKPKDTKVAHVITASKGKKDTGYVDGDRARFQELGFQVEEIDIANKTEKELEILLRDKDIIYVQGGNGFYLLSEVRKSGFDNVVRKLLNSGVIYMGVSAGTYIACPTIEMHNWKRIKENTYGLTDLTAMNLVPFLVSVHYNREKYREKVKAGIASTSLPVRILTDDQLLLVQDGKVTFLGDGEEINSATLK